MGCLRQGSGSFNMVLPYSATKKNPYQGFSVFIVAEWVGFEPTHGVNRLTI